VLVLVEDFAHKTHDGDCLIVIKMVGDWIGYFLECANNLD
jgi:hypothetical protein